MTDTILNIALIASLILNYVFVCVINKILNELEEVNEQYLKSLDDMLKLYDKMVKQ